MKQLRMTDSCFMITPTDISQASHDEIAILLELSIGVLNKRTHKRIVLGEEITVPGSLSVALNLPTLLSRMKSRHKNRQTDARNKFIDIWPSLSDETRSQVLNQINWYESNKLPWDDPRSNRKFTHLKDDYEK